MPRGRSVIFVVALAALASLALATGSAPGGWCAGSYSAPVKQSRFSPRGLVEEESGITASRINPGVLWTHNDNFSPKKIYAVRAKRQSGLGARSHRNDGSIAHVLDLEDLPFIGHHTDFEDISVAHCPFQNDTVAEEDREWCVWVADTGANFGPKSKEILVYVIKEPRLELGLGPQSKPSTEDVFVFKLQYHPSDVRWRRTPNVEAMATNVNGSRFWLVEKTFSNDGDGPAGIWESPDLTSLESLRRTSGTGGYKTTCARRRAGGDWRCDLLLEPEPEPEARGSSLAAFMDNSTAADLRRETIDVHHIFVSKVNEIENPYPDCSKFGQETEVTYSVFDYPETLPVCASMREKQPGSHSCRKQRDWGKCKESWMVEKNFCELTCRRCRPPPRREEEDQLAVRSVDERKEFGTPWEVLERKCSQTKREMRNIRNIAAADLHDSGERLLIATYGGIFEYSLSEPFDLTTIAFSRQVSTTNRDGTEDDSTDEFWKGQEGVCYDYTGYPNHQRGKGIYSVSEHHQGLYYLGCNEPGELD